MKATKPFFPIKTSSKAAPQGNSVSLHPFFGKNDSCQTPLSHQNIIQSCTAAMDPELLLPQGNIFWSFVMSFGAAWDTLDHFRKIVSNTLILTPT